MNEEQKQRAIQIWQKYCDKGERFTNASQEYTHDEIDAQRSKVIPELLEVLQRYISGQSSLDEFKIKVDSFNKRYPLWGFKGINGQMFFNLLTKTSTTANRLAEFDSLLKQTIQLPASPEQTAEKLDKFAQFTKSLSKYVNDQRAAPKIGSINFFVSYFWQLQSLQEYPVYYRSMVIALQEFNLWSPGENIGENYFSFYRINHELLELYRKYSGRDLTLWDVEHAFWFIAQPETEQPVPAEKPAKDTPKPATIDITEVELPDSYIPPVVAILPRLAKNDPELARICTAVGSTIEKVFENRIDVLFKMLGYETEALGQGHGRVPDGVAICREYHYAIGYDAKVRQQPYTMGTDERAIREYILRLNDRLKKQGVRQIYFMIISSSFSGEHDDVIRSLKMDTDVREVLLVEAGALLALLETKLRDPSLTLGPEGIQRLLADSGIMREADIREFQGL